MGEEPNNSGPNAVEVARATLEAAKRAVEEAERELERALSELHVLPRAEKTAVSAVIASALSGVRTARAKVVDAEHTLADEGRR